MTTPANELPKITIPANMLPSDGRFGCGPSKIRPEAIASLAAVGESWLGTSHRQPGVKSVVKKLRANMLELWQLPDGYEVMLGNGGSTSFWDVATFSLIRERSQHTSYGEFSAKFGEAAKAAPHLGEPDIRKANPGSFALPEAVAGIDSYALVHNETSTGVAVDIHRPKGADSDSIVMVDATSAAGGLRVNPNEFDCYYFAPQKCFASDGGLWIALVSPAAQERIASIKASGRWIPATLDASIALEQSKLDQTYNTPALATLWLLGFQVDWMLQNGGLEWAASRCDQSAQALYTWADKSAFATPFVTNETARSHVVGTIDIDARVNADDIAKILRTNGIVDTESYRKLGRNQLRVGMFPAIDPEDVEALTNCIDYIAERM